MPTVTHLYDNYADAKSAATALEIRGVPRGDISIVRRQGLGENKITGTEAGAETGALVGGGAGVLAGLGVIAIPGIGPLVAVGWIATALAGLVAGGAAGGIVGALTTAGVDNRHAHVYAEGLRRGGTLLTAIVPADMVAAAESVLSYRRPVDPELRAQEYRATGWDRFVDKAGPYKDVPPGGV